MGYRPYLQLRLKLGHFTWNFVRSLPKRQEKALILNGANISHVCPLVMQVLAPTTACCQHCTFSLLFLVVGIHMNSSDLNEILSQEVWMNIRQFFALY